MTAERIASPPGTAAPPRPAAMIPRSKIRPPGRDIKPNRKEETIARYEADIRERGIQSPLVLLRDGDSFEILDGFTRYLAGCRASLEEFPAQVIEGPMDEGDKLIYRLKSEAFSTRQDREERALALLEARELKGLSNRELAAELGKSESFVSKTLRPLEVVPEDIRSLFGFGKGRAIYALATLKDQSIIRRLGAEAAAKGWPCKRVEAEVKRLRSDGRERKGKRKKLAGPDGTTLQYRETTDAELIVEWLQAVSKRFKKGLELGKDQDSSPIFAGAV